MIYVVGDSHTAIFKNDPMFKVVDIGGATAHNLIHEKSTSNSHQKLCEVINSIDKNPSRFTLEKNNLIMLTLGECDCRFHVYYQSKKRGESTIDLINETVYYYGLSLRWMLKQDVVPIFVLGIPPPGTYDRFDYDTPGKPYASPNELAYIYREFNRKMKDWCDEQVLVFYLDIYSKTVDENGFLKKEYAADAVHLNQKALPLIKKKIEWIFENFKTGDWDESTAP